MLAYADDMAVIVRNEKTPEDNKMIDRHSTQDITAVGPKEI